MGRFLIAVLLSLLSSAPVCAQANRILQIDRLSRKSPELTVEAGGRTGSCDMLLFSTDGRTLMAVGDDKVVRLWDCGAGGLAPGKPDVLRWSGWRELRGLIYALALSPDADNRHVAIAGLGMRVGTVMVLDRATGEVKAALTNVEGIPSKAIRALAFAPSGKRVAIGPEDGTVWVWDTAQDRAQRLSPAPKAGFVNRVRFLHFRDENTLLSMAADGVLLEWNVKTATARELFRLDNRFSYFRVILSPDGQWLAAAGHIVKAPEKPTKPIIALRSMDGRQNRDIALNSGDFARCLAFDSRGTRLAAGIGNARRDSGFYNEGDDRLEIFDLTQQPARSSPGPKHTWHADAVAFHPDGKRLAVAGGDNHEVRLWDLDRMEKPISEIRTAGSCLWNVGISENGRYLGFREQRNLNPKSPNDRGAGPWRVFDLPGRKYLPPKEAAGIQLQQALFTAGGWRVEPSLSSPHVWSVVHPDRGRPLELPWNSVLDSLPRCYTFLPARGRKPVRLAVGHLMGLSIYDLSGKEPVRTRLYNGHGGEVMSLAATVDAEGREWLVSAATDQTIAAWNLDDWPSQRELGARFAVEDGKLVVKTVDPGSPAWEAGLLEGDEITRFLLAAREVAGGPAGWLKQLQEPVPGLEHYFEIARGREGIKTSTTLRQRPLWRFFPTRDEEWVLWMWRHYYYDTSTHGDSLVGWHVNNRDPDREPKFYKAEQFHDQFHRRDVIDKLLKERRLDGEKLGIKLTPVDFGDIEPPPVRILASVKEIAEGDFKVRLIVEPRDVHPDHVPHRVDLWINDFRFQSFDAGGKPFDREVVVPSRLLRAGNNQLTLQTFTRLENRTEVSASVVCRREMTTRPRLFGLFVGIDDYSKSGPSPDGKRGALTNLTSAVRDATAMESSWKGQQNRFYDRIMTVAAPDGRATRTNLLEQLATLVGRVGPDDRLVLFLAGHGEVHKDAKGKDVFVFCCSNFDRTKFTDTGLTSDDLYQALARLPCRKIVFLDACRSGDLALNPVRSLTPAGKGPTILAACDPTQFSFENPTLKHGLFTYAVLEALDNSFGKADRNDDGQLTADEIYAYVRTRMPDLLREVNAEGRQHPVCFPRILEPFPLAGKQLRKDP
jgi:WD40 repeat protein